MGSLSKNDFSPDSDQILKGIQEAVALALRRHKLLGQSVVIGDEHGMPTILTADQIPEDACAPWPSPLKDS